MTTIMSSTPLTVQCKALQLKITIGTLSSAQEAHEAVS